MITFSPLPWDSHLLDLNCLRLETGPEHTENRNNLVRHLAEAFSQCICADLVVAKLPAGLCPPGTLETILPDWTVKRLGTEIVYEYSAIVPAEEYNPDIEFHKGTADPTHFLPLARDMHFSRYHRDPAIGSDKAITIWKQSITEHCQGFAQETAVISLNGRSAGIATINLAPGTARLHIVGVLEWARGRKLGKRLLRAVAARHGLTRSITVEAHAENKAATALYGSAGFTPQSYFEVLHFWKTTL